MIYFDFEKKFNTINFLTSSMYKPKVSVIYWGLNSIMDDLRMAQMSNNIVSIARSKIEEMNWLKAIIDQQFKLTKRLALFKALSFLIFYLIPLIVIIFTSVEHSNSKRVLQKSCLLFSAYLTYEQAISFVYLGKMKKIDIWNVF